MKNINIGIMGCGGIASVMANTISSMNNVTLYACASRDLEKSKKFCNKFNCNIAYGSYIELVQDKNIDLIYIATPHSHHYEHALLCLNNNKHVLCEKAFMVNSSLAKEIIDLAKSKNLLVAEAMWTRYTPLAKKLKEIIDENIIGKISNINANLFFPIAHVERLYNPNLAGGVTLDLGVYPISFMYLVTNGNITNLSSSCDKFDTGVDKNMYINLLLNDIEVSLNCGCKLVKNNATIIGSKGKIKVSNITNFEKITVYDLNNKKTIYKREKQITGFEYQVLECIDAIRNNNLEVKSMKHQDTLDILKICDDVRIQNNIKYPFE